MPPSLSIHYLIYFALFILLASSDIVLGQANNYGRESDQNINWRNRGVSIARDWNEGILFCIRRDLARPCIHARNLWHFSLVVYDAWAAYAPTYNKQYFTQERYNISGLTPSQVELARNETISYAAYTLLKERFRRSPGVDRCFPELNRKLAYLGFNASEPEASRTPARLFGERIANNVLSYFINDGANEIGNYNYTNLYAPINPPMAVVFGGNEFVIDVNRWQPIVVGFYRDQSGVLLSSYPAFIGPHWGRVKPFCLNSSETVLGKPYVYLDSQGPARLALDARFPPDESGRWFVSNHTAVLELSGLLSPTEGRGAELIDISPAARGNNPLGTNAGNGYSVNPKTGQPYTPQRVPLGDYTRVLAEFWADGPFSETPPGHWNAILNYVSYHPEQTRRYRAFSDDWAQFDKTEWDAKAYFALNGALHDAAIVAWGLKGFYDSSRPITAIRYMAMRGQSSNASLPNFSHHGLPLIPGVTELITNETVQPGQRHENLTAYVGKVAAFAWLAHGAVNATPRGYAGVGWMPAERWMPFQLDSFVTPPFAGYISGHSTYSRTAARIIHQLTGDKFFPGGMHRFNVPNNTFLTFEKGPSVNMELQWATYYDAADESGLSRIYGGIHPSMDDIPGRRLGDRVGGQAFEFAAAFWEPPKPPQLSPTLGTTPSSSAVTNDSSPMSRDTLALIVSWVLAGVFAIALIVAIVAVVLKKRR